MTPKDTLLEKIKSDVKVNQNLSVANNAFGDMENSTGIVEGTIDLPDGGVGVKFYGCDYIFKGFPKKDVVEGLGLAKAMISALPRETFLKGFWFRLGFGLTYLLNRKELIHMVRVIFSTIYINEVAKCGIPPERYSKSAKEIRRGVYAVLEGELKRRKITLPEHYGLLHGEFYLKRSTEDLELIANLTEFACLIIELDSAYRFRIQDVLANLDREALERSAYNEVKRLLDLWVEREDEVNGIRHKVKPLAKMILLLLKLSGEAEDLTKKFFLELDIEKVKLDPDDWYFCLKRNNYHFGGLPVGERLKIKDKIDQERGHVMLNVSYENGGLKITA